MADLVTSLKRVMGAKEDSVVATAVCCMGQLFAEASTSNTEGGSGESSATYRHLPETSILRALVQLLADVTKAPEILHEVDADVIDVALSALCRGARQRTLPPLNWSQLLAPIVRLQLGAAVESSCLRLALQLARSSTSACKFVTSWTKPVQFESLASASQQFLLASLPLLCKCLSSAHLSDFVTAHLLPKILTPQEDADMCLAETCLGSLLSALRVTDPPRGATSVLEEALANICHADVIVSNVHVSLVFS